MDGLTIVGSGEDQIYSVDNKSAIENRASLEDLLTGNFIAIGSVSLDIHMTNEEFTAVINKAALGSNFLKDFRIKFRDDGRVEVTATIGEDLSVIYIINPEAKKYEGLLKSLKGKTLSILATLKRVEYKKFEVCIEKISAGLFPLPVGQNNDGIGVEINKIIAKMHGFSAEQFSFNRSGFYFKGQVPGEIRSIKGEGL